MKTRRRTTRAVIDPAARAEAANACEVARQWVSARESDAEAEEAAEQRSRTVFV